MDEVATTGIEVAPAPGEPASAADAQLTPEAAQPKTTQPTVATSTLEVSTQATSTPEAAVEEPAARAPTPQSPAIEGLPPPPAMAPASEQGVLASLLGKARAALFGRSQRRLDAIMALFQTKQSITNSDVQKLLKISEQSAWRYLAKLEAQGKIIQMGKTGHSVTYVKH